MCKLLRYLRLLVVWNEGIQSTVEVLAAAAAAAVCILHCFLLPTFEFRAGRAAGP